MNLLMLLVLFISPVIASSFVFFILATLFKIEKATIQNSLQCVLYGTGVGFILYFATLLFSLSLSGNRSLDLLCTAFIGAVIMFQKTKNTLSVSSNKALILTILTLVVYIITTLLVGAVSFMLALESQ